MQSSSFRAGITTERSDRRDVGPVVTWDKCSSICSYAWRGLAGPKLEANTIGLKRVQQQSDKQTDVGQRKPECHIDPGNHRVDPLTKDAKEKKQVDVGRNAQVDGTDQLIRIDENQNPR